MGVIYVARSVALSKWGSDVGLSKHIYKVGYSEEPLKALIEAGWAGEHDWALVAKQDAEEQSEDDIIARVARKQKLVDPGFYPRLFSSTTRDARLPPARPTRPIPESGRERRARC